MIWLRKRILALFLLIIILFNSSTVFANEIKASNSTSIIKYQPEEEYFDNTEDDPAPGEYYDDMVYAINHHEIYSDKYAVDDDTWAKSFAELLMNNPIAQTITGVNKIILDLIGIVIIFIGDAILALLDGMGLNLDKIIYGRIGAGENEYSVTTFVLDEDNFWGRIAIGFYRLTAYMSLSLLPVIFLVMLLGLLLFGNTAEHRRDFFNAFLFIGLVITILNLMPIAFRIILFLRDVVLLFVMGWALSMTGLGTSSIIITMREAAMSSGSLAGYSADIVSAAIYLGLAVLTIMYAANYVGIALTLMFEFFLTPVYTMMAIHPKNRKHIFTMFKEVIALASEPIIDSILLLVVALSVVELGNAMITALIIFSMTPTKRYVKRKLGVESSSNLGMASMAAAMSVGMLARSAWSTGKNIIGGFSDSSKSYKSDMANASLHEEMARNEGGATRRPEMPVYSSVTQSGINTSSYGGISPAANGTSLSQNDVSSSRINDISTYENDGHHESHENELDINTANIKDESLKRSLSGGIMGKGRGVISDQYKYQHANTNWLDDSQRRSMLSHNDIAQLYRKRASQNTMKRRVLRAGLGMANASIGAVVGGFSGSWMGPHGSAYGASIGMTVGNGITNAEASIGRGIVNTINGHNHNLEFDAITAGKEIIDTRLNDINVMQDYNDDLKSRNVGSASISLDMSKTMVHKEINEQGLVLKQNDVDRLIANKTNELTRQKNHGNVKAVGAMFTHSTMDSLQKDAFKDFNVSDKDMTVLNNYAQEQYEKKFGQLFNEI